MTPRLSVVIPACNAADHIGSLLSALLPQLLPGDECLVVDDASTDATAAIARSLGATAQSLARRPVGPAAARNFGARGAVGDVLVFLDADVTPHVGLLAQMREHFARSPELAAVFGAYDDDPLDPSAISRFRNLLHCYTHRQAAGDASTFWAGCGAIRRADFERLGGFDAVRFPRPSIEDIELGLRLARAGGRIRLDPALQAQHRKRWTLRGMVETDVFHRAAPWATLILETRALPADLNLKASQRLSGLAVAGVLVCAPLLPWVAIALFAAVVALNMPFYRFLAKVGGWTFALRCVPLHFLYFLCADAGLAIACLRFLARR